MNRHGFSLIELVVGLLLSALLGTVLFNSFFQSSRTLRFVREYAELDTTIATILTQLERDLAGAYEPLYKKPRGGDDQQASQQSAPGQPDKEKKPTFQATTKNKQLDRLTFITTNPRSRYSPPVPTVPQKPSLVRVMYRLKQHKEKKDAFVLVRQESTDQDEAVFEKEGEKRPRELTMAETVKACELSFMYRSEDDEEVQTVATWGEAEEKRPPLPSMVTMSLTVWDAQFNETRSIDYMMPVYSVYQEPPKPPKEKKEGTQKLGTTKGAVTGALGGQKPSAQSATAPMPSQLQPQSPPQVASAQRSIVRTRPHRRTLAERMGRS